jgi:predicted RNA-binding Zn ribbon-like protein
VVTPAAAIVAWTPDDLPLIGEPLAVELANTRYGDGRDRIDFLANPRLIAMWFAHVPAAPRLPARLTPRDAELLRDLRDATHALIGRRVDGLPPSIAAVETLNRHAARGPRTLRLDVAAGGVRIGSSSTARGIDAVLGHLAHEAITLLGGPDAARLRRCDHPECTMAFVQQHRRRRWCHPSCGHRTRQASYYRRRVARAGSEGDG